MDDPRDMEDRSGQNDQVDEPDPISFIPTQQEQDEYDEDQDVCRVCRTEAEPDNPLMYPCKCSGTIRYVHPECLKSWLAQSRKTHCELCGHKYAFTTVYAKEMPQRLPLHVLIYGSVLRSFRLVRLIFRILLVVALWLVFVPKMTLMSFKFQLERGDAFATALTATNYLANATLATDNSTSAINSTLAINATSSNTTSNDTSQSTKGSIWLLPYYIFRLIYLVLTTPPSINKFIRPTSLARILGTSLLRAQLLCISLIGVFLGFFLLREWILHHQEEAALARAVAPPEPDPILEEWEFEYGQAIRIDIRAERQKALQEGLEMLRRTGTLPEGWGEDLRQALDSAPQRTTVEDPQMAANELERQRRLNQYRRDARRQWEEHARVCKPSSPGEQDEDEGDDDWLTDADEPSQPPSQRHNHSVHEEEEAELSGPSSNSNPTSFPPLFTKPGIFNVPPPQAASSSASAQPAATHSPRERPPLVWGATVPDPSPKHESTGMDFADVDGALLPQPESQSRQEGPMPYPNRQSFGPNAVGLYSDADEARAELARREARRKRSRERRAGPGFPGGFISESDGDPDEPTKGTTEPQSWSPRPAIDFGVGLNSPVKLSGGAGQAEAEFARLPTGPQGWLESSPSSAPIDNADGANAGPQPQEGGILARPGPVSPQGDGAFTFRVPSAKVPGSGAAENNDGEHGPEPREPVVAIPADAERQNEPDAQKGSVENENDWEDVDEEDLSEYGTEGDDGSTVDESEVEEDGEEGEEAQDMLGDIEIVEVADDEEELPENDELALWDPEEWDGVLDMIGLRGSLLHLFGNIFLALMVLQTAVFVFLAVPAVIGKVALLFNGAAIQRIFLSPIRFVRFLTDPIVDFCVDLLKEAIYHPSVRSVQGLVKVMNTRFPATMTILTNPIPSRLRLLLSTRTGSFAAVLRSRQTETGIAAVLRAKQSKTSALGRLARTLYVFGEDKFAILGRASIKQWEEHRSLAIKLASGTDTGSRGLVIALGYIHFTGLVSFFSIVGEDIFGSLATPVVGFVRQQGVLLKLLIFMLIELLGFPFGAGIALQACLLPLYPEATIASRMQDFAASPFLSTFIAWLFGTLFMFAFASLLARFREVCRKGTMFFVRNPSDHNYSPVKDIVERTTLSQLRKLAFSAWMYAIVISALLGAIPYMLQAAKSIVPLRIKNVDPISTVPFDMIFIHVFLPVSIKRLDPETIFKRLLWIWWRRMSQALRLSSFMYHTRVPSEEEPRDTLFERRILPVVEVAMALIYGKASSNESITRVPAQDKVALLPAAKSKGSMFVQVDQNGIPLTDEGKMKVLLQNQAAIRAKRDPVKDYTLVWLPSYFQARINLFLMAALATGAGLLAICAFVPLLAGRSVLERVFDRDPSQIYDTYSYVAGFYFLWAAYAMARWAQRTICNMGRPSRLRHSVRSAIIKRRVLYWMRVAYRIFALHCVWPILCGSIVEIYVILPLQYGSRRNVVPVIHVWESWAMGSAFNSILIDITDFARQPLTGHVRAMRALLMDPLANGVQDLTVTLRPLITGAVCLIAAPGVFVHLILQVNPKWKMDEGRNVLIFRAAYAGVVAIFLSKRSVRPGRKFAELWVQSLRDRHYGVETRLENYEKMEEVVKADGQSSPGTASLEHTDLGDANEEMEVDAEN